MEQNECLMDSKLAKLRGEFEHHIAQREHNVKGHALLSASRNH